MSIVILNFGHEPAWRDDGNIDNLCMAMAILSALHMVTP